MTQATTAASQRKPTLTQWPAQHWFLAFAVLYGAWVLVPWLAPIFMEAGWAGAGRAVYTVYSIFCHQLPERSFFLFGRELMYPLAEVQAAWQETLRPLVLRRFIGNEAMGWKVAWSDRMVSFYTTIWVAALVWRSLRRRLGALPWWGFAIMLLPMAVDGLTHAASDLSGFGAGFRNTNYWLVTLTRGSLPIHYAGDALGSFNSWARLITGVLAALGIVWFAFPYMERSFAEN